MNFTILWITLITILATILRIIGIDKAGGLWNDEYISWSIANIPLSKAFLKGIASQCHMPFYYLYLKVFSHISNNDLFLRFSSVIPAMISVPVMYLVGRTKSKLCGILCALFVATSSFLIYFSQEVRFYSILFLFSALSLLFTLRIVKKQNKHNLIGLIVSNCLILFTHTIGFVYVFFNLLFVSIILKNKENFKKVFIYTWSILTLTLALTSPLLLRIFTTVSFSQWWASFSINRIAQVFVDFFTPVISQILPLEALNGYHLYASFVLLATIITLTVIVIGLFYKKVKNENLIFYVALAVFVVMILASLLDKMVFEAKYIIEIYPILIFVFFNTILAFNKKRIKIPLLLIFFAIQFGYLFTSYAAPKVQREEGHKYVAQLINSAKLKQNDYIVLTYYPQNRFEKYQDFSKYNVISIHKGNFNDYILPAISYKEAVKNGKKQYRGTFINATLPVGVFQGSKLIYYINDNIYKKMKTGQKVAFIFLDSVSFLDETTFSNVVTNTKFYEATPLLYIIFSDFRNEIIKTIPVNAKNIHYEVKGFWTLVSFEK